MGVRIKVLVGCEVTATVRRAFEDRGHNVYSCDILPSEVPGRHIQDDVLKHLNEGWDLAIFHPPCTYLCNSGVRWLYNEDGSTNTDRYLKMIEAAFFFKDLLNCDIPAICIENPIPHKYALDIIGKPYSQIIQPWQFGHGETKATCLWLRNLPPLKTTDVVSGRLHRIHEMPPSVDRGRERARTYEGIAKAMADQWG